MAVNVIRSVWQQNFVSEMRILRSQMYDYPILSIDTEFPRLVRCTHRQANELDRYEDVKFNVERSILIQVGVTLMDDSGQIGGTWQFNLVSDDTEVDFVNQFRQELGGVAFVQTSWMKKGIPKRSFAERFSELMWEFYGEIRWVTFHGLYDLAHLIVVLTKQCLPDSLTEFAGLVQIWFGRVYDMKSMVVTYGPMFGNPEYLGLEKLASMIGVKRTGRAHQSGSDSLMTSEVFGRLINIATTFGWDIKNSFEGFIYHISTRIVASRLTDFQEESNGYIDHFAFLQDRFKLLTV